MKQIKPQTMPTKQDAKQIQVVTDCFFDNFSVAFIAEKTGQPIGTVKSQKSRGILSGKAATEYCQIKEVKAANFTREKLRPDIKHWYGDNE